MRAGVIFLALLGMSCEETRRVNLTFGTSNTRVPLAFRCRDDTGRFLAARAVDRQEMKVKVALLVDFIGLGGLPSCRLSELASFCETHRSCTVLADPARWCLDLEAPLTAPDDAAVILVGELVRSLEGRLVTPDAPHDPVIVRAVATAQPCSELTGSTPVDVDRVVGCAMSCPVQLDGVDGDVLLDLPTLSDRCASTVVACAQGILAPE